MNLELFFLGTGASVPTRSRNVPALGFRRGSRTLLVDCGEGTQRQVQGTALTLPGLEAVLLTHLHGDHVLGLPGAILSMEMARRTTPLRVVAPRGSRRVLETLLGPFRVSFPILLEEMSEDEELADIVGCRIRALRTLHGHSSLAYRIDEPSRPGRLDRDRAAALGVPEGPLLGLLQRGEAVEVAGRQVRPSDVLGEERRGRSIVASGDTAYLPELAGFARGADVLVHEATYGEEHAHLAAERHHSTAAQAARVAADAGAKRLFLVHLSPRYHDPQGIERLLAEARAIFPNTEIPSDLSVVEIPLPG